MQKSLDVPTLLSNVLSIIGYSGNTQAFLQSFFQQIFQTSFFRIEESLPQEKKLEFKQRVEKVSSVGEIEHVLSEYISVQDYQKTLEKVSQEHFVRFLDDVSKTLSEDRKNQLQEYIASIVHANNPALVFPGARRDAIL